MNIIQDSLKKDKQALLDALADAGAKIKKPTEIFCPFHDNTNTPAGSIKSDDNGHWRYKCFSCEAGGDIFDVRALANGTTVETELKKLNNNTKHRGNNHDKHNDDNNTTSAINIKYSNTSNSGKIYLNAQDSISQLEIKRGKCSNIWTYTDKSNNPIGIICRWDNKDGKKILPVSLINNGWQIKAMPEPRPLYRLPELIKSDTTIYICEGEKSADAATSIGLNATSNAGGSNAVDKTDWQPLAGREVILLPDNDNAGDKWTDAILKKLPTPKKAKVIRLVDLGLNLPNGTNFEDIKGGDIADLVSGDNDLDTGLREAIDMAIDDTDYYKPEPFAGENSYPVLVNMADVEPKKIQWLWPDRIALGKLTVLSSDPGCGKSTVTIDIASRISTGSPWPDDTDSRAPKGSTIMLSAEDDPEDTIRPRLDAANADVSKVIAMQAIKNKDDEGNENERCIDLSVDLEYVKAAIENTPDCKLIVVDPISSYLGNTDSHKNAEVRGLLMPLSKLAADYNVAVLAISHLTKGSASAIYRTMGSIAFVAAARAAWCISKDKDDDQRRLLLPVKHNIGKDHGGLAYRLMSMPNGMASISWEADPVEVTADEALSFERGTPGTEPEQRNEAEQWLRQALAGVCRQAGDLLDEGKNGEGFSKSTIERARKNLGIKPKRTGFKDAAWWWQLPNPVDTTPTYQQPRHKQCEIYGDNVKSTGYQAKNGVSQKAKSGVDSVDTTLSMPETFGTVNNQLEVLDI